MSDSSKACAVVKLLKKRYGKKIPVYLDYHKDKPYEFLFSVIMSAQCKDSMVNSVTHKLYEKYPTIQKFANAKLSTFEKDIYSVGFYRRKAISIIRCAKVLIEKYDGKVPRDFDELLKLPGVGRKTASVVVSHIYGIPAMAVDTHVARISKLIFNIKTKDAREIEEKLKMIVEKKDWTIWNTHIIALGREICASRHPKCDMCIVKKYCDHNIRRVK